jgi:hypothetical protein
MSGGAVFEYGWREDHARKGDEALEKARDIAAMTSGERGDHVIVFAAQAQLLAAIAQAHYAAANVRARPIRDVELPAPQVGTGWIKG